VEIRRLGPGDLRLLLAGAALFDAPPTELVAERFLSNEGHHLLYAVDDDGEPVGFVSGVETAHPDKGTEMFLYELSVAEAHRRRGIATALVRVAGGAGARTRLLRDVGQHRRRQRGRARRLPGCRRRTSRTVRDAGVAVRRRLADSNRCFPRHSTGSAVPANRSRMR
jgi:GNAT superfamily N-acetyltransferase